MQREHSVANINCCKVKFDNVMNGYINHIGNGLKIIRNPWNRDAEIDAEILSIVLNQIFSFDVELLNLLINILGMYGKKNHSIEK